MIAAPIIAHRGAMLLAPENTLSAMANLKSIGVSWVEIDANLLGDGTAVVFHDQELDRLTNRCGSIARIGLRDLSDIDAGLHFSEAFKGERIPRLDTMLQWLDENQFGLNLEVKMYDHFTVEAIVQQVVRSLEVHWGDFDRLIISSFSTPVLSRIQALQPEWQLGQLCVEVPTHWKDLIAPLNLVSIHCAAKTLTAEVAAEIKQAGYELYVYTVNDRAEGEQLYAMGVDGLITDDPTQFMPDWI